MIHKCNAQVTLRNMPCANPPKYKYDMSGWGQAPLYRCVEHRGTGKSRTIEDIYDGRPVVRSIGSRTRSRSTDGCIILYSPQRAVTNSQGQEFSVVECERQWHLVEWVD